MPRPLTANEIRKINNQLNLPREKAKVALEERFQPDRLPDYAKTEALIAGRKSLSGDLKRTAGEVSPTKFAERPLRTSGQAGLAALQGLGVASERIESGVANPLLTAQKASPLPARQAALTGGGASLDPKAYETPTGYRLPALAGPTSIGEDLTQQIGPEKLREATAEAATGAVAGVKGERLGKLGDIIRREDLGPLNSIKEPIAATVGFFASVGLDTFVASSVGLVKLLAKMSSKPIIAPKQLANYTDEVITYVDDFRKTAGKTINTVMDEIDIAPNPEWIPGALEYVKTLPKIVSKELKKLSPVEALKKVRNIAQKKVKSGVWSGVKDANPLEAEYMQMYHKAGDLLADLSPKVREAWKAYHEIMKVVRGTNSTLYAGAKKNAGGISSMLKGSAAKKAFLYEAYETLQTGVNRAGEKVMQSWPRMIEILKATKRFNQKEALINIARKTALPLGATAYLGSRMAGQATGDAATEMILPGG